MVAPQHSSPPYPVRKATLLKVIKETSEASEGSRLILLTAVNRRWKSDELIGSFVLGMFLGEVGRTVSSEDFELIHTRIRNRDILPIVGSDPE